MPLVVTKGEPEDAEMRRYSRVTRVRGVVGSVTYAGFSSGTCAMPAGVLEGGDGPD